MRPAITRAGLISFLTSQHRDLATCLRAARSEHGAAQRAAFQSLVRLLAVHETAEREVVHPLARGEPAGPIVVTRRLREEGAIRDDLEEIERLDIDSSEFADRLADLADVLADHTTHEEQTEFPLLSSYDDPNTQLHLAHLVFLSEQIAPHRQAVQGRLGGTMPTEHLGEITDLVSAELREGRGWVNPHGPQPTSSSSDDV